MPSPRLHGKVAIITGGGSGFGAGIVQKFHAEGCRILIWDINPAPAHALAASLNQPSSPSSSSSSSSCSVFIGDVSKAADWDAALAQCLHAFGTLDIVVNNAGVVHVARPSEEVPEDEVDRMWRVNVKPLYHSARAVVPYFRREGRGGVVVNLSSVSAPRPRPRLVWYAASKGAVTAATRGLAAEYAADKIRYNCIQPVLGETAMVAPVLGGTDTPEGRAAPLAGIPLGRMSTPRDIANAACFLASDEAEFLTGVCLDVDGGRSLM
ncbi:NAD(P)-binding protein [Trematosphaeria pertusa]|uniref:NAD(P)-binding protein n=1 Tax=Trematosphaeria pertusa TaxID=390896 RepID=A0A6A6IF86_9PLEO|nr:NAD(P)-binding protein [Trematosphaeria pertusa]KAF2249245.1 NAD(P)-binding protein [Trematosphaeria pertusa]